MHQKPLEHSPGVDFNTPAIKRHQSLRFLKNHLTRWGVAVGGIGVILAIVLIFFYLLYEVYPLFKGAQIERVSSYHSHQKASALYLGMEEQAEIALRIVPSGQVYFTATNNGSLLKQLQLPLPEGVTVSRVIEDAAENGLMAAGLSNGQVILFKREYRVSWPDNKRVITPGISYPYGEIPLELFSDSKAIENLALSDSDEKLLVAASAGGRVAMTAFKKAEDFLTEETSLEKLNVTLPLIHGSVGKLLISDDQSWLYVANKTDRLAVVNIAELDKTWLLSEVDLTAGSARITEIELLLGGVSLLAGDSEGTISQWFLVRDDGKNKLTKIRQFRLSDNPVTMIIPEHRRKGFLAADSKGHVGVFYTTAHRSLLVEKVSDIAVDQIAIAPRSNFVMVDGGDAVQLFSLNNEHPEISWSALWDKVWYESYEQPDYVWQSSASNNDFEPKLSLTPLAFGTLKAAFYAMLLATPLAICGAIYTAYFMAPALRRKVKPAIELMEALPTVILGFLAGLWLAPMIENHLAGIIALLLLVPVSILLFAFTWDNLPRTIRHAVPDGWQAALLIPVVFISGYLAIGLGGLVESILFNGDIRTWLTVEMGIPFDQRNALVVGLAMGFAVIPTIFSIAEDAIFSVPRHLSYGSLALGATPWQTLTRVVLLTASPGIFSAVMIGMGRAVGETMIVLMATGNTPIMDANIFEGMRTLAANIAVEMPESEVGSSHYRILFLAALVLFLFTFVVNTMAELIRHRLRKKYSSL